MKQFTILAALFLALVGSTSCKKEAPVAPACKSTSFTFDYVTDLTFVDCQGRLQEVQYKPGTHQVEGSGIQAPYSYSNVIRVENNLDTSIELRDQKRKEAIKPASNLNYIGSNEFSVHFDDDTVEGVAILVVDGKTVQTISLTSSPLHFFANIQKGSVVKVVLLPTPLDN